MVSRNNDAMKQRMLSQRRIPHYSLRKLGIGVVSVLLGTTMYFGGNAVANADTVAPNNSNDSASNTTDTNAQSKLSGSEVALTNPTTTSAVASSANSTVSQASQDPSTQVSAANKQEDLSNSAAPAKEVGQTNPSATSDYITSASSATSQANQPLVTKDSTSTFAQTNSDVNEFSANAVLATNNGTTNVVVNSSANSSSQSNNIQPAISNNDQNKSLVTTPATESLGQLNFYYYANQFSDPGKSNTVYTIPFTKANGKLAIINLENYKSQIINAINAKTTGSKVTDIVFKDSSNHYITSIDPNKLGNESAIVPIYITTNIQSSGGDEGYGNLDDFQKALDTVVLSQKGVNKIITVNESGIQGGWGIRTPDEALADGVPYEPTGVAAYSSDEFKELFDSQYIKIKVDSQNSSYPSGNYYIDISSALSYLGTDDSTSFNTFIDNYKELLVSKDTFHLKSNEDLSTALSQRLFGSTTDVGVNVLNQEDFDTQYADAAQQDQEMRAANGFGNNSGYAVDNGYSGSVLLPEYDANNNLIKGKYAGRVFIYTSSPEQVNATIHIVYVPFDTNYIGKLNSLYLITSAGSNGSTRGFLTIHAEQDRKATINYIDDSDKTTLKSDSTTGLLGSTINFTITPEQQIADYEQQGYILVSNDYQDGATYQDANAKNVFNVHLMKAAKANLVIVDASNGNQQIHQNDAQGKAITTSFDANGKPGATIAFKGSADSVTALEKLGYVYVSTNLPTNATFDNLDDSKGDTQQYQIVMKHAIVPVTPDKPGNGLKNTDLQRTVTETIHYIYSDNSQPETSTTKSLDFTGSGYYDAVTKQWTDENGQPLTNQSNPITWTIKGGTQDQGTFNAVTTPQVAGYTANVPTDYNDNGNVKAITGIMHNSNNYDITVVYTPESQRAGLKVIDKTTGEQLAAYTANGPTNSPINFGDAQNDIQYYLDHGYAWDSVKTGAPDYAGLNIKNFDDNPNVDQNWTVYLDHTTTHIDKNHPGHGYTPADLEKTVTTTVNYLDDQGKALTTPVTNSQTFEGSGDIDNVTNGWVTVQNGKITGTANGLSWTPTSKSFEGIPAKTFTGYNLKSVNGSTDQNLQVNYTNGAVSAQTMTPTTANSTITEIYTKQPAPAPAQTTGSVTYVDDSENESPLEKANFSGTVGEKINYTTADRIAYYEGKGYKLVSNNFKDGQEVYSQDAANNNFVVHLMHITTHIDKDHPGHGYTPADLEKTVTTTVNYLDDQGKALTTPVTNSQTFEGSGDIDNVTNGWVTVQDGKITGTANGLSWTPTSKSFEGIPAKTFTGYNLKSVNGSTDQNLQVNYTNGAVSAQTMTPTTANSTITEIYTKQPAPIKEQYAQVQYIDLDNNNQLLNASNQLVGQAGQAINYSTADEITALEKQGYVLASDGFPAGATFDNIDGNEQIFKVTFHHGVSPVNPDHPDAGYTTNQLQKKITRTIHYLNAETGQPVAPEVEQPVQFTANGYVDNVTHQLVQVTNGQITGPGQLTWTSDQSVPTVTSPKVNGMHITYISRDGDGNNVGTVTLSHNDSSYDVYVNYVKNGQTTKNGQNIPVSQTVHFVDEQGNPILPDNVQSTQFTRTPDVVDTTTGQTITTGSWNETSHQFGTIKVPVIPGYVTKVTVAGGKTATTKQPQVVDTVVYYKVGKIIPVDQNGKPIPSAPTPIYTNNPTNPTQVTPDEPTPTITGWTTKTPSVTPSNPTEDTKVVYTKVTPTVQEQEAIVKYLDQDEGNREIANSGILTGKPGAVINYSTGQTLQNLYKEGYVLVNNGFDYNGQVQYFDNDNQAEQVYVVTLKHSQSPVNPDHPNKNISPDEYTKQVTSTVHYVGAGSQTPADYVQNATWTRTLTIDNVTGQIINHGQYDQGWTPSQTNYGAVITPVISGYQVDQEVVPSQAVTMTNQYTVVTYHQVPSSSNTPGSNPSSTPTSGSSATPGSNPSSTPTSGSSATPGSNPSSIPTSGSSATPGSTPSSTPTSGSSATPGSTPSSTPTSGSRATPGSNPSSTPTSGSSATPGSNPSSTPTSDSTAQPGSGSSANSGNPSSGSTVVPGYNQGSNGGSGNYGNYGNGSLTDLGYSTGTTTVTNGSKSQTSSTTQQGKLP